MATIQPPPVSTPILLDTGVMSLTWIAWFQSIHLKLNQGKALITMADLDMASSQDFEAGISTSIDVYEIELTNVLLSSLNSSLLLRASIDGGDNYLEASNAYGWSRQDNGSTSYTNSYHSLMLTPQTSNNQKNYEISGVIRLVDLSNDLSYKMVQWSLSYFDSSDTFQVVEGCGHIKTALPVNAIRILPSAGSISSGTIAFHSLD